MDDVREAGVAGTKPWHLGVTVGLVLVVLASEGLRWWLAAGLELHLPNKLASSLAAIAFGIIGALVVRRGEAPRYGWLLLVLGVVVSTQGLALEYTELAFAVRGVGDSSLALFAGWYQDWWMVPWLLGYLLLPALFPDGRPASPRWRWPVRLVAVAWMVEILGFMTVRREMTNWFDDVPDGVATPSNPTGWWSLPETALEPVFIVPWVVLTLASVVVGIGSLVSRWRRAGPTGRRQVGWVLWGMGLLLTAAALDITNQALVEAVGIDLGLGWVFTNLVFAVALVMVVVALGFAVLRYRLYDLDRVVNRTLVYGALTVGVIAMYVLGVVGVGRLFPAANNQGLALGTTAAVALAFDPVRRWVQGGVNRLMFGQRDDPYVVLSSLGHVMAGAGTPSETLQSVVETVARSLKLPWVAIELDQRDGQVVRVEHGDHDDLSTPLESVPLVHRDEQVGRLLAAPRSTNEALTAADRRLLADVAHQAGAVAATARLTTDLQHSREQLVLAREEERRRIRRDLHDGLGPSLAAQALALDAAADRVTDDPDVAHQLLDSLKVDTQQLVADIRRLVHDLRPPALDELGLAGALVAHVARIDGSGNTAVRIRTQPDPLPELSAAVEVAAWRIACEALTNVVRHADASRCTITVTVDDDVLAVEVVDDGIGLPVVPRAGVGLQSMRDRAEELGGTFIATDTSGGGTVVQATLPIASGSARRPVGRAPDEFEVQHGR